MENEIKPDEVINELVDSSSYLQSSILTGNENISQNTTETNCLALTVRKNYSISIFKNSILKTLKLSYKVILSTFLLNLLKFFF